MLRACCCAGLNHRAAAQMEAGRPADALETLVYIDERYGGDDLEEVQASVAMASAHRGVAHWLTGETHKALAAWADVVARFGSEGPLFHDAIAVALAGKSVHLAQTGDVASALAACADLIERSGDSDDPFVRRYVAGALFLKAELLVRNSHLDEALATIEDLMGCLSTLLDPRRRQWIEWTRVQALLAKGEREHALEALQSAYDQLIVDEHTPSLLLHHVPELIGSGLTEGELLKVLTSDPQKSQQMSPIVGALKKRIGESVRIPTEVLEVAQDLATHLDEAIERVKTRKPPAPQNSPSSAPSDGVG